jgi:hypothetical protein
VLVRVCAGWRVERACGGGLVARDCVDVSVVERVQCWQREAQVCNSQCAPGGLHGPNLNTDDKGIRFHIFENVKN